MKTTISQASATFDATMHRYTMSLGVIKGTKVEKQMPSRFGIIKPRITIQAEPAVS